MNLTIYKKYILNYFLIALLWFANLFASLWFTHCSNPTKFKQLPTKSLDAKPEEAKPEEPLPTKQECQPQVKQEGFSLEIVHQQRKIDILFIVDNSGSMNKFQQNLSKQFAKFAESYLDNPQNQLDLCISIITTDYYVLPHHYWKLDCNNLASEFESKILVGIDGWYDEKPLLSLDYFLRDHPANSDPAFRQDSIIVFVFLTDEVDHSELTIDDDSPAQKASLIKDRITQYINQLNNITINNENKDFFVVGILQDRQEDMGDGNKREKAVSLTTLVDLTKDNGSFYKNINYNYGMILQQLGETAILKTKQFQLKHLPLGGKITLKIAGLSTSTVVPEDKYEIQGNTIVFKDPEYLKAQALQFAKLLEVEYKVQGNDSTTCTSTNTDP